MRKRHYSRKTRQLKRLIQELKSAQELNFTDAIKRIKFKIKSLIHQLVGVFSKHQLRNVLGSAAVVIGLTSISNTVHAQNFAAPIQNAFNLTPTNTSYGGLALVDLDNDGDLDILQGQYYGVIDYFQNTGTATNPSYALPQTNTFGLDSSMYISLPAAADLDNDGDMDLLVGEYYGNMQYYENTVTPSTPSFAAPVTNPFGITAAYIIAFPTFADLDLDGDLDLMVGEYYGNNQYFENTGTSSSPVFSPSVVNPFGLVAANMLAIPAFGDLDNDGDLDLMVNEYYENLQYFENTQFNASVSELEQQASIFPNPFSTEVTIESELNIERVDIYSIAGQLVKSIEQPSASLDLRELDPGMYLFKAYSEGEVVATKKLKKQ